MARISGAAAPLNDLEALAQHPIIGGNRRKAPAAMQAGRSGSRIVFKSTLHTPENAAFEANMAHTKAAARIWSTLAAPLKHEWRILAAQRVASSKVNAKKSTRNHNRKVSLNKASGFGLFLQEYHAAGYVQPKQPNATDRGAPVQNVQLLIAGDYEQRVTQAIAESSGAVDICVYQASANWSQQGVARTLLFEALLALPSHGRTCRLILAQPLPGTNPNTFNVQARADMEAAGWLVRYAPPSPLLHAKFWLIEPYTSIIGSHNLSNRAVTSNIEASVMLNKPAIYDDLKETFNEIFSNGS